MIGSDVVRSGAGVVLRQVVARLDDRALERVFGHGPVIRTMADAMAAGYRPDVLPGFRGMVVHTLTKSGGGTTTVTLEVGAEGCAAQLGQNAGTEPPAAEVRMPVADFVRIAAGLIDPAEPLLQGRATFTGDLGLAARLPEMFGAPRLG